MHLQQSNYLQKDSEKNFFLIFFHLHLTSITSLK